MRNTYDLDMDEYAETILNAMDYSFDVVNQIISEEVKEVEHYILNEQDRERILAIYFERNIEKYNELDNIYKRAYESFEISLDGQFNECFLDKGLQMDVFDKIDGEDNNQTLHYIVKTIEAILNTPLLTSKDFDKHSQHVYELEHLSDVIVDTHIARSKMGVSEAYLSMMKMKNDIPPLDFLGILKNQPSVGLESLFNDKQDYIKIVDQLKYEGLIKKNNDGLKMIKEDGFALLKSISCLGYCLEKKGYLKEATKDLMAKSLSKSFQVDITPQTYNSAIKDFEGGGFKGKEYISKYHFIPNIA